MNFLLKIAVILFAAAAPLRAEGWEEGSRLPAALEKPLAGDAMGVTIHRLGNGLTVYLSPNDQEPRIAAWIAVRAGAAHDPADSTGMAHYLEHMLFKGSERLGTMDYAAEKPHLEKIQALYEELFKTKGAAGRAKVYKRIDEENQKAGKYAVPNEMDKAYKSMGIRGVNAFTSKERTVYICDLPKNRVPAWSKLEGDRFKSPVFRLFQSEIETVYEEFNMRSLDNPHFALYERLYHALYGKTNPYGRSVIGTVAHLKNPSLAKMYAFYDRWYVPNNMAVALSGDFDRREMLALLEAEFGFWEPKPIPQRAPLKFPPIKGAQRTEFKFESEETVVIAWRTVGKSHPDSDALTVLDMVMDNSEAGIVNLTLNQAQKVKRAGSYPSQFVESGAWQLYASPKEGQTLEQAEKLLLGAVEELKNGEFTDEDLQAIVRDFEIGEKKKLESNSSRVAQMADAFLTYEPWERSVGRLKRLRAVTKEDVLRVAKKYLASDRVVIYRRKGKPELPKMVKPEFAKFALDSSRESVFFKEIVAVPAEPIEPKWVKEGRDYKIKIVPSGRLYVVKNPINDLFSVSFRFERGRRHERYLCAALDLLNLAGADQTPAEELKKKFYALGVKMNTYCGEESSGVSLSGLEESLKEALALMRRRFAAPKLEQDTLKKMVEVKIGAHQDNKLNPRYVFSALSQYAQRGRKSSVLSELADGELVLLSESELRRLLMSFFDHKRRTSYVGTMKASEAAKLLGGEEKSYYEAPQREPRAYVKRTTTTVVFVERKMAQAQVGVFWPEDIFDSERYVDYKFFSTYMGGGMSAVIFQEIREARSLAYSAWGGYSPGSHAGDENRVIGRLGTQADKTIEATGLLTRLLREMPVSEARFVEAQKSIEQGYRTNPIKFRSVAGAVMGWEDRGLKRDPRPARMKKALSYSLKDLTGFAERFRERNATIYILGNAEGVDLEGLKSLGTLIEKKINDLFPY